MKYLLFLYLLLIYNLFIIKSHLDRTGNKLQLKDLQAVNNNEQSHKKPINQALCRIYTKKICNTKIGIFK